MRSTRSKHYGRRQSLQGTNVLADQTTRQTLKRRVYIRDFDRIAEKTRTANELYGEMLVAYPNRVNPGTLWSSARALKA
jgi:hypothetical protein